MLHTHEESQAAPANRSLCHVLVESQLLPLSPCCSCRRCEIAMQFKGIALLVLLGVAGAAAQGPIVSKKDLVSAITSNKQLSELLKYASQVRAGGPLPVG